MDKIKHSDNLYHGLAHTVILFKIYDAVGQLPPNMRARPQVSKAVKRWLQITSFDSSNPNIPHEIRPAVYCTMVREGDGEVREALEARLEIEPTHYERLVILQSLACSQDEGYING